MTETIEKIINWTVIILAVVSGIVVWLALYLKFPEWRLTTVLLGMVILIIVLLSFINWKIEIVEWFDGD